MKTKLFIPIWGIFEAYKDNVPGLTENEALLFAAYQTFIVVIVIAIAALNIVKHLIV